MTVRRFYLFLVLWICTLIDVETQRDSGWWECQRPTFDNGYIVPRREMYEHGSTVQYGCNPTYKPIMEPWWGEMTCRNGVWSQTPSCIDQKQCGPPPIVPHAKPLVSQETYDDGLKLRFLCERGYSSGYTIYATCENGRWTSPKYNCRAQGRPCLSPPPQVKYAVITSPYQSEYAEDSKVVYECVRPYKIDGTKESWCREGKWVSTPRGCRKYGCDVKQEIYSTYNVQDLPSAVFVAEGESHLFYCKQGFRWYNHTSRDYQDIAEGQCKNEHMIYPTCDYFG
ncbi:hypothetical protein MATL_G00244160 [Megalops atlanticus]|uniref:Sushi domain-containing protein n=1 Tax=Megalops atlanticus TaxID=7932 RepID=A0A9D3PEG4_MEGAT|nr:hypothetical protein MATL_G00244160 [Megalops atlanticus]